MTNVLPERDDDRFEEVLERLDALVRRGQPESDPPPPPPAVSEASIPVLTEVYRPELEEAVPHEPASEDAALPELSAEEKLEQAMDAALPVMTEVLENALAQTVRPALNKALDQAIAELCPQMEALLRQRLQQALAQEDQTEI
ncbi:MAG TPA: hypothetical protein VGK14_12985 [Novimethylophilus sp.]|jgi:hypothetical protein|uniref:hypothetical protein n=1 Tax=Novimethylophilus sp. TaxID=2137426 RepID=UPI002F416CBD